MFINSEQSFAFRMVFFHQFRFRAIITKQPCYSSHLFNLNLMSVFIVPLASLNIPFHIHIHFFVPVNSLIFLWILNGILYLFYIGKKAISLLLIVTLFLFMYLFIYILSRFRSCFLFFVFVGINISFSADIRACIALHCFFFYITTVNKIS